jgi:hypothetical protein
MEMGVSMVLVAIVVLLGIGAAFFLYAKGR